MKKKVIKRPRTSSTEYIRRIRTILNGLAFDLTTHSPDVQFGVSMISKDEYEIKFQEPLENTYAATSYITVMHMESKRTDTTLVVLPKTDDKRLVGEDHIEFVTHVVKMDTKNRVETLRVILEDIQLNPDMSFPILTPHFALNIGFFPSVFPDRYVGLPFPVNETDISKIPQIYGVSKYKPSGITSSRVAKLLGYYPTPDGKPEVFNSHKITAMHFGTLNEPVALMMYLAHHPECVFKEIGFVSLENSVNPANGAQPDGVLVGKQQEPSLIEFKCSRNNSKMEASHMAQCIWEMACGYPHIDLVKYCEKQVKVGNNWTIVKECKEVRLFRFPELENKIIELCQLQAHKPNESLANTKPFVEIRAYLDKLAEQANIDATPIPIREDLIQQLIDYKKKILDVQAEDVLTVHPLMDRIEKRQMRIFAAYQDGESRDFLLKEVSQQIQDYAELIKK